MGVTKTTYNRILEVSGDIFYKKGLAGARMQEIADLAGINKAMLHYYFKTKEQLFSQVFEKAFSVFIGRIAEVLKSDKPLKEKVSDYVDQTIDSLKQNPHITVFVVQELNANPERITELFAVKGNIDFKLFQKQINKEYSRKINAEMFFTDMVALCIYPFIARPVFKRLMGKDDPAFQEWIEQRKDWIKKALFQMI